MFFGSTIIGGGYSYDRETPRSYGYIWNLPPTILHPRVLDWSHGEIKMPPDWKSVYGPMPVKVGNELHEEWQIILVQW